MQTSPPADTSSSRRVLSTFVTTFNLNGTLPSSADVQSWLGVKSGGETASSSCPRATSSGSAKTDTDTFDASCNKRDDEDGSWPDDAAASATDLVFISLQECPTSTSSTTSQVAANKPIALRVRISGPDDTSIKSVDISTSSDSGIGNSNSIISDSDDSKFLERIQSSLSPHHGLVADVSMGVAPGTTTIGGVSTALETKWYGYIRLLVYARGSALLDELRRNSCAIVVPVGIKLSQEQHQQQYEGHSIDQVGRIGTSLLLSSSSGLGDRCRYYPFGTPDKGAVCLALPTLGTIFVAPHLAGSNKYGVAEIEFDRTRHSQLQSISEALEDALMNKKEEKGLGNNWHTMIAGDLNFRVEVHDGKEDKIRRGRDWEAVVGIVQGFAADGSDSVTAVSREGVPDLFRNHDRLIQYLSQGPSSLGIDAVSLPSVLQSSVDLLHANSFGACAQKLRNHTCGIILPTFPFGADAIDDSKPNLFRKRIYTDKRTPSWSDRILLSRQLLGDECVNQPERDSGILVGSCPSVRISDHVAVRGFLRSLRYGHLK